MPTPSDLPDLDMAELDRRRGAIIALWAGIESAIDKSNHYGWLYSKKTVSKIVPQSLRWKIQLFQKINRDLLPFAALREKAADLLDWVERRYEDRHWMAHGYVVPWLSSKHSWHFLKHEFQQDGSIKDLQRTFTRDELLAISSDLSKLTMDFAVYLTVLVEEIEKHDPKDLRG